MAAEWKSSEPDSTQKCVSKTVEEVLFQVDTQEKVDNLILALLNNKKQAHPNKTEKER